MADDRRDLLKKMLALGVAAPLAGAWPQGARPQAAGAQTVLTSQQLAGQRVIFSCRSGRPPPRPRRPARRGPEPGRTWPERA